MNWFYPTVRLGLRIGLFTLTRWQVNGQENIPRTGALLVVANHLNNADPPLVGASIDRKAAYMAKEELFQNRFFGSIIGQLGAFPVHRGSVDMDAIRQSERAVKQGLVLVMFPEGKRSLDAKMHVALPGSALVAARNRVQILPVGITGTEKIKGLGWVLQRPQLTVNIGRPFYLPPVEGKITKEILTEQTDIIMRSIAELLPKEYRGIYAG